MIEDVSESLHSIDTRLTLVEAEVNSMVGTKNWVRGIMIVLIAMTVSGAMAFAQMIEKVDSLDLDDLHLSSATALTVLADHGTEIQVVRQEQFRQRESMDLLRSEMVET